MQQICVYMAAMTVTLDNKEFCLLIRYQGMDLLYKWHDWRHRSFVLLHINTTYQSIGIIIFYKTLGFEGRWSGVSISTVPVPMRMPSRQMVWFSLQHVITEWTMLLKVHSFNTLVMENSHPPFSFGHIDPVLWCTPLYVAFAYQYLQYCFSYSDC